MGQNTYDFFITSPKDEKNISIPMKSFNDTLGTTSPSHIIQKDKNGDIPISSQNKPVNILKSNKIQNIEIKNGKYVIVEKEDEKLKSSQILLNETDDKNEGDLFDLSFDFPTSPDHKTKSLCILFHIYLLMTK